MTRSLFIMGLMILFTTGSLGCATIIKNKNEDLPIITDPPGAVVTAGDLTCHSPCDLEIERKKNYQVKIEKPGYRTETVDLSGYGWDPWIWANVVWAVGFPFAIAYDFYTGYAYDMNPAVIDVKLKKLEKTAGKNP